MRQKEISLLFFLSEKHLEVIDLAQKKHIHIPFTEAHIKNQEVVDKERLFFHVRDRLEKEGIEQRRALLFLADDLVSSTHFSPGEEEKTKRDEFMKTIPLDSDNIVTQELKTGENIRLFATNRELYSVIVHSAERATVNIVSVAPWSCLGYDESASLTFDRAQEGLDIYQENEALHNFFPLQGMPTYHSVGSEKPMKKIIVLIIVFAIAGGGIFFVYQKMNHFFSGGELSPVPSSALISQAPEVVSPSPIPSPSVAPKKVSELTVKIVNGTGIAGQAGKVKKEIDVLGVKTVTTENSDAPSETVKASVVFSAQVDTATVKKITDSVQKLFTDPSISTKTSDTAVDVLITTGVEK